MSRSEFARVLGAEGPGTPEAVVIEERTSAGFRRKFAEAAAGSGPVFLANPDWGRQERGQFDALTRQMASVWDPAKGWLMIPTGGSSGAIKLARHDQGTLTAAVRGYQEFFGVAEVHSFGVLPLHHVGGLMGWLRSALSHGHHQAGDWRQIADGKYPRLERPGMTVSLVPAQLNQILRQEEGVAWARQFAAILMGGAILDEPLRERARAAGLSVVPSYGMTETAAMVCAVTAVGMTANGAGVGAVLPHVDLKISDAGTVVLAGASLFRGYWPAGRSAESCWGTGDLGEYDEAGNLHIRGRADDLIISGGEKVNPAEVEAVLRRTWATDEIAIVGVPSERWGQQVVLCHSRRTELTIEQVSGALDGHLAKFKWPKVLVEVADWPTNPVGKIDRQKLRIAAGDFCRENAR